jgi:tetratricopeptide (TPR) repeat protein
MTFVRTFIAVALTVMVTATPSFAGKAEEVARLFSEAASQESRGQWSLASSNYSKIIEKDPENALAHDHLARCQVRVGMNDYAIKNFKKAIQLDPNLQEAREGLEGVYVTQGLLARQTGKRSEALAAFEEAVVANPKSVSAALELGAELESQGQSARAMEVYGKVASAAPDDATGRAKLGAVYAARGDNARAVTELEAAVKLNPRDAESHKQLGFAYAALGNRENAAAAFHQAMRQYVLVGDMVKGSEAETLEKRAKAGQPLK